MPRSTSIWYIQMSGGLIQGDGHLILDSPDDMLATFVLYGLSTRETKVALVWDYLAPLVLIYQMEMWHYEINVALNK